MMKNAEEFRRDAREVLRGKRMPAVGVTLIAALLGASIDMAAAAGSAVSSFLSDLGDMNDMMVSQGAEISTEFVEPFFWGEKLGRSPRPA